MLLETWLLYTTAIFVVILIPGPLSLLMVSNSLNYGILRTTPAFLGGVSASVLLLTASALGLGALLMASEQLFSVLKLAGALYINRQINPYSCGTVESKNDRAVAMVCFL